MTSAPDSSRCCLRVVRSSHPKVYHGPDAAPEGFQEYRDGKISFYKIVYEL